jgi:Fic family protein
VAPSCRSRLETAQVSVKLISHTNDIPYVDGLLERPLLYLSLYFKQRREEYYARLGRVRTEGDWEGWVTFFAAGVIEVAENAVTTAKRLADLIAQDRERIRRIGRGASTALRVHEALQREPLTTLPRLVARTKLSKPGVTAALRKLMDLGSVNEVSGRRRGRVCSYAPYVQVLGEGTEPLAG